MVFVNPFSGSLTPHATDVSPSSSRRQESAHRDESHALPQERSTKASLHAADAKSSPSAAGFPSPHGDWKVRVVGKRSRWRRWNSNEEPAVGKRGRRERADFKYKRLTLMLFARGLYENERLNNSIFQAASKINYLIYKCRRSENKKKHTTCESFLMLWTIHPSQAWQIYLVKKNLAVRPPEIPALSMI